MTEFDEDRLMWVTSPAIADVPTGLNATAEDNANAINDILAAIREAGIVAED